MYRVRIAVDQLLADGKLSNERYTNRNAIHRSSDRPGTHTKPQLGALDKLLAPTARSGS